MLVGRRPVQYVFGVAGRRQDRAGGCVCAGMSAASGELVLCAVEAAGQDRPDDAREEADVGKTKRGDGGRLQAAGNDRADDEPARRSGNRVICNRVIWEAPVKAGAFVFLAALKADPSLRS